MTEETDDLVEVPDLTEVSGRRMRLTVWRGVIRTALVAVVVLAVGNQVLLLASKGWQNRGSHDTRFFEVVSRALVARHPGYVIESSLCCTPGRRFDLKFEVGLRPPDTGRRTAQTTVKVRQNWKGHIAEIEGEPDDFGQFTGQLFTRQSRTKDQTRRLLEAMPTASTIIAVANLTGPVGLDSDLLHAGPEPRTFFFEQLLNPAPKEDEPAFPNPLAFSWPVQSMMNLRPWANQLKAHDQRNLLGFSVKRVKAIAKNPKIHAVLYERSTPTQLLQLLDRTEVDQLTLLDAALETDPDQLSELPYGEQRKRVAEPIDAG